MEASEGDVMIASTRIVVTADERPSYEELCEQLKCSPDIELAGRACDGKEVIAAVGRLNPDILILDIDLLGIGGLELLPAVRWWSPDTKVIIHSSRAEEATIREAIELGARGYIVKSDDIPMDKAIRAVQQGEVWVRRRLIAMIIDELIAMTEWPIPPEEPEWIVASSC
ncbi:MAG: response regulator transcription factor [candidate division NC10 bacterium]|nr:response regulator transcription factor [candidate division NC10 bacterium]